MSARLRIIYAEERPEWQMEKYRFYCELPGDIWEDGYFMQLIKMNQVHGAAVRVRARFARRLHLAPGKRTVGSA